MCGRCVKSDRAVIVASEHAVKHQGMQVHVQVQRRAEPLHDDHGATAPVGDPPPTGMAAVPAQNRPYEHRNHRTAKRMVPRQGIPHPRRQRQDPLPDRHIGKHVVHQVRRALGHTPAAATRTEAPALARERDEPLLAARRAPETREPRRQAATRQEVLKRALNEPWQALPFPMLRDVCAKRFVVLTHNMMQRTLLGPKRAVVE